MSKELLKKVETHLKDEKGKAAISIVVARLDGEANLKLPAILQTKLDSIGIIPNDEKDIAFKQLEIDKSLESQELDPAEEPLELLEAVYTQDEIEEMYKNGVNMPEFIMFGQAVKSKVFSHKYFDENQEYVFKEIDLHTKLRALSFFEGKELRKLAKKQTNSGADAYQKILESRGITTLNGEQKESLTDEEIAKLQTLTAEIVAINKTTTEIQDQVNAMALKYSGFDEKDFSNEWEKNLTVSKMIAMSKNEYISPVEKN